jgi:endonuclease-3 related protein
MIIKIYEQLLKEYGPQGWWPFKAVGYHPNDYSYPKNSDQTFEVALGSILTQNTTFLSVQKALDNLEKIDALTPKAIQDLDIDQLKLAIKPAGYFNQKASYILNFCDFFNTLDGRVPSRDELLKVKGIGEETADSILLYGYNEDQFKVDAYTKRLLCELGIIEQKVKYQQVKALFEQSIQKEIASKEQRRIIYQEYHALIVEHGKRYYSKKPYGNGCFLKNELQTTTSSIYAQKV